VAIDVRGSAAITVAVGCMGLSAQERMRPGQFDGL